MSRHDDALQCQMGASNPIPVAMSLYEHSLALLRESQSTDTVRKDPALRMIAHQLAHLYGVASLMDMDDYNKCIDVCLQKASDSVVRLWNRQHRSMKL